VSTTPCDPGSKRFITRVELAELLRVSLRSVDERLGTLIPYFRIGARIIIDREEAIAALRRDTGRDPKMHRAAKSRKEAAD
jgi:hypothetical protein